MEREIADSSLEPHGFLVGADIWLTIADGIYVESQASFSARQGLFI